MARATTQRHQSLDCLSITSSSRTNKNNPSKMKSFIVLALFVAAAVAAPAGPDADAQITRFESDNIGVDGFKYLYEASNGIAAEEQGQLKNQGTDNEALEVQGSFRYVGPDGVTYSVTYIANENGFQPQGAHLPVAP